MGKDVIPHHTWDTALSEEFSLMLSWPVSSGFIFMPHTLGSFQKSFPNSLGIYHCCLDALLLGFAKGCSPWSSPLHVVPEKISSSFY